MSNNEKGIAKCVNHIKEDIYELELECYMNVGGDTKKVHVHIPEARISVNENHEIEIEELLSDPLFELIIEE